MKSILIILLIILIQTACKPRTDDRGFGVKNGLATNDTLIGRRVITDQIPGSAYRKRAFGYFIIVKGDTSDVMAIFSEAKDGGTVNCYFRNERTDKLYSDKLVELKAILPDAAKDFIFDSLRAISIGRLVANGDLAVDVTKEFISQHDSDRGIDNVVLSNFMMQSKLARDVNSIFEAYSVRVTAFSLEKSHFTSKKDLMWASNVKSDSADIPDKVIDCLTWIKMGPSK